MARVWPGLRITNVRTQKELNLSHTVRERLLAVLGLFFAFVAVVLAGVGLYGVLDYSVLQRRREIGVRIAVGAGAGGIVRLVTTSILSAVIAGAVTGLALGIAAARYMEALFYQVRATDATALALPSAAILAAALLAGMAPVIRAVRIDPIKTLRTE
jgi:ABC-type antimicrobial peptide transport system permease subunit